jgi:hypothetical protein
MGAGRDRTLLSCTTSWVLLYTDFCITVPDIRRQLAARITAKNKFVSRYRECLPRGAQVWLLLYTRVDVSRSMPIPYGIDEWRFPFDFEKVLWFTFLEKQIIEIRRLS